MLLIKLHPVYLSNPYLLQSQLGTHVVAMPVQYQTYTLNSKLFIETTAVKLLQFYDKLPIYSLQYYCNNYLSI